MNIDSIQAMYQASPANVMKEMQSENDDKKTSDFSSVLDSAMKMISETNSYQIKAQNEEIKFALGESSNTHDLAIAQKKANIALQYTVAVRDKFIQAYQEIMNMQI